VSGRALAVAASLVVVLVLATPLAAAAPDIVKRSLIQESARISDIGQEAAREALSAAFTEQVTEADVVTALSQAMIDAGSSEFVDGFEAIVASGPASSIPHGDPSDDGDNFILPGEVVVVDIGARYKGWVSDNTKTYFMGTEPPEEFVKVYKIVQEAQVRGYEGVINLAGAEAVDALARSYIEEQGYGEYFIHCLGHGVGYMVHVKPLICTGSNDILSTARNDVVAIEPGIYLEGCFGVRIEDDFAVLRNGYERYTFAPSELEAIMIAPPAAWNGESPSGEFGNYSGCTFEADGRAAAGSGRALPQAAGGGSPAALSAVALTGVAAVALIVLHRVGKLPPALYPRALGARAARSARAVAAKLRPHRA
jgi:methionine aminopeptidase